ncbi:hypothetical protein [Alloprevotella tannerae]|uniref:hypothetical protein n=1 Tax=Alloprevotella tannerae TaxID=76122 RepID=UPI0028E79C5C|nr:hypothetical protein [Alloprevotella tannerae]
MRPFSSITAIFRFVNQHSAFTPPPVGSAKENVGEEKGDVGERKPIGSNKSCDESVQKVEISVYSLHRERKEAAPARAEIKQPAHCFACNFVSLRSTSSQKAQAGRPKHSKLKQAEGRE